MLIVRWFEYGVCVISFSISTVFSSELDDGICFFQVFNLARSARFSCFECNWALDGTTVRGRFLMKYLFTTKIFHFHVL